MSAIEEHWNHIVSTGVQQVIASCGDHVLEASNFGLPEKLTLRDAAGNSRSALWLAILVAAVHTCLDAGCVIVTRLVRRALRTRIHRLRALTAVHNERADSLIATLHINWGSMLMAATGRPKHVVKKNSIQMRQLEKRIDRIQEAKRAELTRAQRARSEKRAKLGQPPVELVEPYKSPRQKRLEMHERRLGIAAAHRVAEPETDEEDEVYGIVCRADLHMRRVLAALRSPSKWVRQAVGLSLSAVHSSSIVGVVHALVRRFDESRGKMALALAKQEREMREAEKEDAKARAILPVNQTALGEESSSDDDDDEPDAPDSNALRRAIAKQAAVQMNLTRLMRLLAQHRGMANALEACPEILRQYATFIRRVGEHLFTTARRLLKTGRPAGALLENVNPDGQLPWCIDYLAMVGALADAVCRRREGRRHNEFASLLPGISDTQWPLDERYALYSQLKLWSSNGEGKTVKRAEEIELRYKLREESEPSRRRLLAVRLERGARRRLQHAHWALAQLLCTGPVLPIDELSESQMEEELMWAVAAEREASFTILRPLLCFHFDALLPIYFVYTRSVEPSLAALYQAALFMPAVADQPDTSMCVHHVRMSSIAAQQLKRNAGGRSHVLSEEDASAHAEQAREFRSAHERNVAAIVIWALLMVVSPEVASRLDAITAIYALAGYFAKHASPTEANGSGGTKAVLPLTGANLGSFNTVGGSSVAGGMDGGAGGSSFVGGSTSFAGNSSFGPDASSFGKGGGGGDQPNTWLPMDDAQQKVRCEIVGLDFFWPAPSEGSFSSGGPTSVLGVAQSIDAEEAEEVARRIRAEEARIEAARKAATLASKAVQALTAGRRLSARSTSVAPPPAAEGVAEEWVSEGSLDARAAAAIVAEVAAGGVEEEWVGAGSLDARAAAAVAAAVAGGGGASDVSAALERAKSALPARASRGRRGPPAAAPTPPPSPPAPPTPPSPLPSPPAAVAASPAASKFGGGGLFGRMGAPAAVAASPAASKFGGGGLFGRMGELGGRAMGELFNQPDAWEGEHSSSKGASSFETGEMMGERVPPSVQQLVLERLGKTSGRILKKEEVHAICKELSRMLASSMSHDYAGAVLAEAGNVMMALMDLASRRFCMELLLPWSARIAFMDTATKDKSIQAVHDDLVKQGFCLCKAADVLPRLFEYTLQESLEGVPEIVANLWRTLALAVAAPKAGGPPHNVPILSAWVTAQTHASDLHRVHSERDKQTCRTLSLFLRGLSVKRRDEQEIIDAREKYAEAVSVHRRRSVNLAKMNLEAPPPPTRPKWVDATDGAPPIGAKMTKAMELMAVSSKQRREKSTRQGIMEEEAAIEARRRPRAVKVASEQEAKDRDTIIKRTRVNWKLAAAAASASAADERARALGADGGTDALGADLERRGSEMKIRDEQPRVGARKTPMAVSVPGLRLGGDRDAPRRPRTSIDDERVARAASAAAQTHDHAQEMQKMREQQMQLQAQKQHRDSQLSRAQQKQHKQNESFNSFNDSFDKGSSFNSADQSFVEY